MPNELSEIFSRNFGSLPFPPEWIKSDPRKVEKILSELTVQEQTRCISQLTGKFKMALLILSPQAVSVVRALPAEEVYHMVKEVGEEDSLPVLSVISADQMQYIFDMEWWQGDRFNPQRALDWLQIMDQANDQSIYQWFLTEDFDQKVMLLQSLIDVKKAEEDVDPLEGREGQTHFTPDGVFYVFFKVPEVEAILKKIFKLLFTQEQKIAYALLEAVIWYPLTPTVETAYRWLRSRVELLGIPSWDEAQEIYSQLSPENLTMEIPRLEDFLEVHDGCLVPPGTPLGEIDPGKFFGQCLAMMKNPERLDAICWELVYLANKVMIADRLDLSVMDHRKDAMRKALGYVNIGLELGAGQDIARGETLLTRTWMQSLFQVGYTGLLRLKWEAEQLIKDQGRFLGQVMPTWAMDHLAAVVLPFPKLAVAMESDDESEQTEYQWKNLESVEDIQLLEGFLNQVQFYVRFCRQSLNLTEEGIRSLADRLKFPERPDDMDVFHFFTTALARYSLFGKLECEPLHEDAAKSFLQVIFTAPLNPQEGRVVDRDKVRAFLSHLLTTSLAWTDSDKSQLDQLAGRCVQNLEQGFGRLDFAGRIEWKYTRGLLIQSGLSLK